MPTDLTINPGDTVSASASESAWAASVTLTDGAQTPSLDGKWCHHHG